MSSPSEVTCEFDGSNRFETWDTKLWGRCGKLQHLWGTATPPRITTARLQMTSSGKPGLVPKTVDVVI